ncbi:MAG: sodium/proline symporter [Planctomycetes bacterium]|nr:sodium/proline symporter [Planctomycetota bacterium]
MTFVISFVVYTLLIIAIGIVSSRYQQKTDEDYFLAGRKLGPVLAALSASASSESGWVTLGLVGWAFQRGMTAYWILPGVLLGFIFNWFVLAGRMREHSERVGALTIPDVFSRSFKERVPILRILCVLVILTAMWLYIAAQFAAAGKTFSAVFTNLDYIWGVVIGAGVVLAYTVIGGFRAACWTDFAQAIVMVGTLAIFPAYLLITNGGYGFITERLHSIDPGLTTMWPNKTGPALIGFLLGSGALGINFGFPGQPHVLVRFMALRDKKDAYISGVVAFVWAALVLWGAVTIGLIVRAMVIGAPADGADQWIVTLQTQLAEGGSDAGETGLVLAAQNLLPGVLSGMVLAAVLSAICSTADSQLVVAASAGAHDIYSRLFDRSNRTTHLLINRTVLLVLGVGAMLVVLDREVSIYRFVLTYGWAILGASFGPQLILLLLWKRASYCGCVAGMVTGFAVAIIWPNVYTPGPEDPEVYNLPLAFICALVVNAFVSVLTPGRERNAHVEH